MHSRNFQVIEKLTRCMKAIILEHREEADSDNMNSNICHLQNYRPPSVSPVYSMCEEDLTQFSQVVDTVSNTKDAIEVDEIIDLCIDDDENDSGKTATVDFIQPPPVTVEVDIQRAVSNLSLQELPAPEQPDTCSQSILNNFVTNEHIEQNLTNVSEEATAIYLVVNVDKNGKTFYAKSKLQNTEPSKIIKKPLIRPNTIIKPKSSNTAMSQNINTKTLEDITAKLKIDSRVLKPTNHIVLHQDGNKEDHVSYPGSTKTIVHQDVPVFESSKISVETSNATSQLHPHETKKKLNKEQNVNTSNIKQKTAEPKKKRAPRKKKNVDTKENKAKSRQPKKMSTQKSKLPPSESDTNSFNNFPNTSTRIPIYNDQVINDLSWMENIRFVREIGVEENDQSLTLEESFWDNYHLPPNWSDSEFL